MSQNNNHFFYSDIIDISSGSPTQADMNIITIDFLCTIVDLKTVGLVSYLGMEQL